jgi:cytochrome o ubiquinol oxidase subunit 1
MWWLAILCLASIAVAIIIRASDDDSEYTMSADEVKAIEDARFAQLAKAPKNAMEDEPGFAGQPVPEAT